MAKDRESIKEERKLAKQRKAQRLADKYSELYKTPKQLKQRQDIEPPKVPITPEKRNIN
ncbi:hypothetical protein [Amphritea pacifica]|uniref:hypothetical protein n=1 Tax=Amphritea pacifica TaxID=2811233 RepID=UPI001963DC13|nr:hypothetical protein [Amphritea pacifica]MBN1006422.1 hypothetical protein [Amphritea pacifica]